jgi:hypothetical protein
MKRTLLILTLCIFLSGFNVYAQEPYTLTVFDQAVYYGMYEGMVSEPIPDGAIRNSNSSYGKKLTDEQIDAIGNRLTMTVTLNPLCDNYDRIGNANLAFVPKNSTSYVYNDVQRIELGRFITPFMDKNVAEPNAVPYEFEIDNVTDILHDPVLRAEYDFWVELEVYGYQGGPGQGGAAVEIQGCAGRNDVYMGSLEFESLYDPNLIRGSNHLIPLSYKFELKNYVQATETNFQGQGTDVLDTTQRTINFTVPVTLQDAKFYIITSNHGSGANGEEYVRRTHNIYLDGSAVANRVLQYRPGGVSCVPYSVYNTQFSCIYNICYENGTTEPRPDTNAAWSWNNWCPGSKIPTRTADLGNLTAGEHFFKINIPTAQFFNNDGYFPMSVYVQGFSEVLGNEKVKMSTFTIAPNPVNNIATINVTNNQAIKSVVVANALGQTVMQGKSTTVDMSSLQSGVYMVKVFFDNGQAATKKIIKK